MGQMGSVVFVKAARSSQATDPSVQSRVRLFANFPERLRILSVEMAKQNTNGVCDAI